jgi:iron(III) transport system ATP-binding protein
MPETSIRLRLDQLIKEFPDRSGSGVVRAVDGVSLDIRAGEFLTLLGPSGCGKTTTLRLISGFELPSSGKLLLDGQDITNQPPNKRDMALVFQNYALFPHMSVEENVGYGLETRRMSKGDIAKKVGEVLKQMGLNGLQKRRPNQLSGGQQQRVALARSLIMEPRILLFDEPLSNLDAKLRVQMRSEIHQLQRRLNITSIYVTHDQVEAMALSDRVVVMNNGKIEQLGSPVEIYSKPKTRFVADFIGRANFFPVVVEKVHQGHATVQMLERACELPLEMDYQSGMSLVAMLRPEALVLREDPALPQVTIEQAMYLGSEVEYIVNWQGQSVVVVEQNPRFSSIYEEGLTIGLDFKTEAAHLIPA